MLRIKKGNVVIYSDKRGMLHTNKILRINKKSFKTPIHRRVKFSNLIAIQRTIWDFL